MKKRFLFIYIALIISYSQGLKVDYGLSADSFIGGTLSESPSLFGYEKASVYASFQFSDDISMAFDGFYKFLYSSTTTANYLDFETIVAIFPVGNIAFQLGRNNFSDFSGDIISHKLDGVMINLPLGFADLTAKVGYSGLVNRNDITILSASDETGQINRLIESVDIVKEFDITTIWGSFVSYQALNDYMTKDLGIYLGGGISGAFTGDMFYSLRSNFKTGLFNYKDSVTVESAGAPIVAGMGVLSLSWYINMEDDLINSLSPYVTLDFGVSSGDGNLAKADLGVQQSGISSGVSIYSPIMKSSPGVIYSVNNQNLTYFKLGISASPLKNLQAQIVSTAFFRTVKGVMSDTSVDKNAEGNYIGTELSLTGNYRLFSDLGITFVSGLFIPDGTVLVSKVSGLISAYVSLSL